MKMVCRRGDASGFATIELNIANTACFAQIAAA